MLLTHDYCEGQKCPEGRKMATKQDILDLLRKNGYVIVGYIIVTGELLNYVFRTLPAFTCRGDSEPAVAYLQARTADPEKQALLTNGCVNRRQYNNLC
jgi:hypothetical protein